MTLFVSSPTPAVTKAPYAVTANEARAELQLFATEDAAREHCPGDTIVWPNTNSGIYHEKGMRWYGRTRNGAYVCRALANAAGDHDTQ